MAGIESPINGIWSLNEGNPVTTDSRREGDDHIRLIKDAIKKTFANINANIDCTDVELNILSGATISTAELNYLEGVTSTIQSQIDDPTIMHTDENNVTVGFFRVSENLIDVDRNSTTALKAYFRMRDYPSTDIKAQFVLYAGDDATRPYAFGIMNGSGDPKFIARADAGTLELTSTDVNWEGNTLATGAYVNTQIATCSKNSDFIVVDTAFSTISGNAAFTANTGFGATDFTWGVGGLKRTDGAPPNAIVWGTDDAGFKQRYEFSTGPTDPGAPSTASAGTVNFLVKTNTGGTIGWTLRLWARKNI